MNSKFFKFKKKIKQELKETLSPTQDPTEAKNMFLTHTDGFEFVGNPKFNEFYSQIVGFHANGKVNFENSKEKFVSATTGELKLANDTKIFVASFLHYRLENDVAKNIKRYIVFKPESQIIGAENVWDKWDIEKTIFVKENFDVPGMDTQTIISVVQTLTEAERHITTYSANHKILAKDKTIIRADGVIEHYTIAREVLFNPSANKNEDVLVLNKAFRSRNEQAVNPLRIVEEAFNSKNIYLANRKINENFELTENTKPRQEQKTGFGREYDY